MALSGVYKDKDLDDLYRTDLDEDKQKSTETRMIFGEEPEEERRQPIEVVRKRASPTRLEDDEVEELRRMSPEIIGNIFDRVKFLKERIDEMNSMMKSREVIHQEMVRDIEEDVTEKEAMSARTADMIDRRNIKLDISVLRKEKRSEIRQYWRDLLELRTELQELMEQHRTESRIIGLFKDEVSDLKNDDSGTDKK